MDKLVNNHVQKDMLQNKITIIIVLDNKNVCLLNKKLYLLQE